MQCVLAAHELFSISHLSEDGLRHIFLVFIHTYYVFFFCKYLGEWYIWTQLHSGLYIGVPKAYSISRVSTNISFELTYHETFGAQLHKCRLYPNQNKTFSKPFSAVTKQLCEWFCLSICPSFTPISQCSSHKIIMTLSKLITIDRSDVGAKGQGQRSKNKITEGKTNFSPNWTFLDRNTSLNSQLAMKWCTKLRVA